MGTKLLNYALYQVGWTVCVLGAARDHPWAGLSVALAVMAIHVVIADRPRREIRLILWAGLIGVLADTVQGWLGVFRFSSGYAVEWLAPPWIVVMWMQFAMTFHYSLGWVMRSPRIASVLGALGGPAAFWAGARLGAMEFGPNLFLCLLSIAVVWAVALPALAWITRRGDEGTVPGTYRLPRRGLRRGPLRRLG